MFRCNRPEFPPVSFFPGEKPGRPILSPGKNLTSQFFPHPVSFFPPYIFLHYVIVSICFVENWVSPSFCHWDRSKNDFLLLIIGVGKNWASPFLPHLEKWKHQPCADGYLGGEKLGRPILSSPRLVKTSTIPCNEYANNLCFLGGGEKLGRPILSPPQ